MPAPQKPPKSCKKPKMPPGTKPDKPRKPPWAEAVTVRRDRLVAGHAAHEAKELLKMREAMAEKGYNVSVVPVEPIVQLDQNGKDFVSLDDVMHRANDLNAAAERLLAEVLEFGGEDGQFYTAAETIAQMTEGLVDEVDKERKPYVKKREKKEADAKKLRDERKAERDKAEAEAAAEEAAAAEEDKRAAAALSDEEEQQDDDEEDDDEEDSDDDFQQVDEDEDDDDDDGDDDDAPPPAAGGASRKKKRERPPATSDDEEDEAPAPAPAPTRARKPAAKKYKKPAAAAPMEVDEAVAPINVDLTAEGVAKMKVSELRSALEARGLSTVGLKKVLKERLLAAMDEGDEESVPEVPGTTI